MIFLLGLAVIEIEVAPVSFRASDSLAQVVVYYSIPYNQLSYEVVGDSLAARFGLEVMVEGDSGAVLLEGRLERRAMIPSFQEAERRDLKLLDGFDFIAQPGRYRLRLKMENEEECAIEFSVPTFSEAPALSNLVLCSGIEPDTAVSPFIRFGRRLTPNPGAKFGRAYGLIYGYIEVYNLVPDSGSYELSYRIEDDSSRVVKEFPKEVRIKPDANLSQAFSLSARGLKPGGYRLMVEVRDGSTNNVAVQDQLFEIEPLRLAGPKLPGLEEREYYGEIEYLATPDELRRYRSLSEEGRTEFLRRFWQRHDYEEFELRAGYADANFGFGGMPGHRTDRGRVYIRYGPPSQVERYPAEGGVKPQEYWFYYSEGHRFVFVDLSGVGNYELIYSNLPAEPKDPNWRRYVNPALLWELE